MLALGIDVGTSGVRTAVLDGAEVISSARADALPQPQDRIDATFWWTAVATCLTRQMAALRQAGRSPSEIGGIAVDGTSGSMVLTDAALRPVSPALMYNSKGFHAEAARIAALQAGPHITKGSNSALARALRLVSLAEAEPRHLLHQADYIVAQLTAQAGLSDYSNALKTGFDPETERWPDWVSEVIDPTLLPDVHAPGTTVATISQHAVETFGLAPTTRVHAGTTDSLAAFLAAAPFEPGVAVTSLGSTLAIKLVSPVRIDDPEIGLYAHRIGSYWLVGGASNTGGAVLKASFTSEDIAALSAKIDTSEPTGLDYYPLLEPGERFPINDPALPPRMTPRPESDVTYLHGLFEGMARIEAMCFREMSARGATFPTRVYTAGGGAQNPAWRAIRALHLGLQPSEALHTEASVGTARLVFGM